jgi:hypothetical protein
MISKLLGDYYKLIRCYHQIKPPIYDNSSPLKSLKLCKYADIINYGDQYLLSAFRIFFWVFMLLTWTIHILLTWRKPHNLGSGMSHALLYYLNISHQN